MPPQPKLAPTTRATVDAAANSIVLTRKFAAPRERVFAAWTTPDQVAMWWDPSGVRLKSCRIDLHPGGAFEFVSVQPVPPFCGVYTEITPPERIVFEAMGAIGRVELEERGGMTWLVVTIQCPSPEHLQQFLAMGVDEGTGHTLDNLVAYVEEAAG
jgi:uncharacterized protein YndB with AHSA1/START domain